MIIIIVMMKMMDYQIKKKLIVISVKKIPVTNIDKRVLNWVEFKT